MPVSTVIHLTYQIDLLASLDTDENHLLFKRSQESGNKVVRADLEVEESGIVEMIAAETNFTLPLGKVVTGKILYIETEGDITVKLNGGSIEHSVKPVNTSHNGHLLIEGDFTTAPQVTNASASAAVRFAYFIGGMAS